MELYKEGQVKYIFHIGDIHIHKKTLAFFHTDFFARFFLLMID